MVVGVELKEILEKDNKIKTLDELAKELAEGVKQKIDANKLTKITVERADLAKFFGYKIEQYREWLPTHIRKRLKMFGVSVVSVKSMDKKYAHLVVIRSKKKQKNIKKSETIKTSRVV